MDILRHFVTIKIRPEITIILLTDEKVTEIGEQII